MLSSTRDKEDFYVHTFQCVFQERDVKKPVRHVVSMFHLHEEPREYQEWADEKSAEYCPQLYVENRSTKQTEALSHKAHQQINKEEARKAKNFQWLTSHEVRDENVNHRAKHLDWDVCYCQADEISSRRIPAIEVFALYNWKF